MIRATLPAIRLRQALDAVTVLVDTATIQFGPDGLSVETVDPTNVGAVSLSLLSGAFTDFEGEELEINVDVARLSQIITKIEDQQPVKLRYDASSLDFSLDVGSYDFDLSLIDPDSVHSGQRAADISPPSQVVIEADEFRRAVNMANMFSDDIILGIDEDREVFYLNAQGDNDKMAVSFNREDDAIIGMEPAKAHTIYGLSYLTEMVRAIPSNSEVKVELGEEFPAKIHFRIAGGEGRVVYGLAPRVK